MPSKTIRKFGRWIGEQVDGFAGGLAKLATTPPKSWLPAGIWSTIVWLWTAATYSVGTSTAIRQITSSFALLLFALLTSWLTLGATLVLAGFFAGTMGVGFLRLIPVVDQWFVSIRDVIIPPA